MLSAVWSHVMGHSWGALCALEAARLTPNIASLVLYDPPVIKGSPDEARPGFLDELDELIAQDRRDEVTARFLQTMLGRSTEQVEDMRADPSWTGRLRAAHTIPRELRASQQYFYAWTEEI